MNKNFTCPFTGQEILKAEIKRSEQGGIISRYYPVKIGDHERYFSICESFFVIVAGYRDSDIPHEFAKIKPVILHEFINENLEKFGGSIMHWDCKDAEGRAEHIILKNLLKVIETDKSYPKSRKQKADNLLLYINKRQNQAGGELKIEDDPIIWGDLFFANYAELIFYVKELERKNLLRFDSKEKSVVLAFDGLDYIEKMVEVENDIIKDFKYQPKDKFDESEKEIIIEKIDILGERLMKLEVGQQITYDDLMLELDELKKLLSVLGKNDWKQVLKGKLIDAGFGVLTDQVVNLIIDTFQDEKLLNG